jgi:mono/diheme cytochrome c family protein
MKSFLFLVTLTISCVYLLTTAGFSGVQQDDKTKSIERGKEVYSTSCLNCHQMNGEGLSGVFPPLAGSDHLSRDQSRSINVILLGQNEEITVNGVKYAVPMAALNQLTDQEIADVLNYVGHSWGNQFSTVTPDEVKSVRK